MYTFSILNELGTNRGLLLQLCVSKKVFLLVLLNTHILITNLDGERGRVQILSSYSSMGEVEKVNAQMDEDEKNSSLFRQQMKNINLAVPPVDHFYHGI